MAAFWWEAKYNDATAYSIAIVIWMLVSSPVIPSITVTAAALP